MANTAMRCACELIWPRSPELKKARRTPGCVICHDLDRPSWRWLRFLHLARWSTKTVTTHARKLRPLGATLAFLELKQPIWLGMLPSLCASTMPW